MPEEPAFPEVVAEMLDYIAQHNVMTVATTGSNGSPHAADVFYANDGFTFFFVSDPKTRHGRDILANPQVALTIHEDYDDWRKIKGIQAVGRAERVSSTLAKAKAAAIYLKKFAFAKQFLASPSSLGQVVAQKTSGVEWWKIEAAQVWFTNNERSFGYRAFYEIPDRR